MDILGAMAGPAPCPTMDCGECIKCNPERVEQYWQGERVSPRAMLREVEEALDRQDDVSDYYGLEALTFAELAQYDALRRVADICIEWVEEVECP